MKLYSPPREPWHRHRGRKRCRGQSADGCSTSAAAHAAIAATRRPPHSCRTPFATRTNSLDSDPGWVFHKWERAASPDRAWSLRPRHRWVRRAREIPDPAPQPMIERPRRQTAQEGNSRAAFSSFVRSGCFCGCCSRSNSSRLDQMQAPGEQRVRLSGPPDMNDAGVLQFSRKYADDQIENVVVERAERAIDEYPGRRLQQHACNGEAQLLVRAQFTTPTGRRIKQRRESLEAEPVERVFEGALLEAIGLQGIGENFAQGSARHVGCASRQVEYLFARRARDAPGAPRPESCQCPEE